MFELTAFVLSYLMYLIVEAPFASILSGVVKKRIKNDGGHDGQAISATDNGNQSVEIEMNGNNRKLSEKNRKKFDPVEGV